MRNARFRFGRALLLLLTLLMTTVSSGIAQLTPASATGEPVYPDLRTAPPSGLRIDKQKLADGKEHYLLRFDNEIDNFGGPLEIAADPEQNRSRTLYQNVYDALSGGTVVLHQKVAVDLIYHPTHNHFHVTDFARYSLYVKASNGVFRKTSRYSAKTTFCILDTIQVDPAETSTPAYTECNAQKQGLSHGWGDMYISALPDQWIDLGRTMLSDGDYAIHSTSDPLNRFTESDETNNTAITQFTIQGGKLVLPGNPAAYCAAKPDTAPVGATVTVACESLLPNHAYDLRWRYPSSAPIATGTADQDGTLYASFVMPPTSRGAHMVLISDDHASTTVRAVVDTSPALAVSPSSGATGTDVSLTLTGFTANAAVTIGYALTSTRDRSVATVTTDATGGATLAATVPISTAGTHLFRASEGRTGTPVTAAFFVRPTVRVSDSTVHSGDTIRAKLRGFGSHDLVTLFLVETGTTLATIRVDTSGAAESSAATSFTVPPGLAAGRYTIRAVGSKPVVTATVRISVSIPPTVGAASAATPTATATSPPAVTSTPEPTVEPSPTEEPTTALTAPPEPTEAPEPATPVG
jgi:hypothetical protein